MAWNGSSGGSSEGNERVRERKARATTPAFNYKALAAGLIVVLGGGIAAWLLLGRAKAPAAAGREGVRAAQIAEVKPQLATQEQTVVSQPTNRNVRMERGVEVLRAEVATNKSGSVVERLWLADGTTKRKIYPPKPVFENPSDQLIAMAVCVTPGQSMPPLPGLSNVDEEFAKSLLSPIRIEDDDSDEVKEMKARVMEARAYLAEEVKKGGTVREALRQYQADMEKFADNHLMAVQQIQEIRETEGEEAAREFRERVNESFRARGIPELETQKENTHDRRGKR